MEHINVKKIKDDLYKLTPDQGYLLKDKVTGRLHTEAVCKDIHKFVAVLK